MWKPDSLFSDELYHHGILGMKWGVRRTPEQLGHKTSKKKQSSNEKLEMYTVKVDGQTRKIYAHSKEDAEKKAKLLGKSRKIEVNNAEVFEDPDYYRAMESRVNKVLKSNSKTISDKTIEAWVKEEVSAMGGDSEKLTSEQKQEQIQYVRNLLKHSASCDSELYHYGVLGMKWGIRKERQGKRTGYMTSTKSPTTKRLEKQEKKGTLTDVQKKQLEASRAHDKALRKRIEDTSTLELAIQSAALGSPGALKYNSIKADDPTYSTGKAIARSLLATGASLYTGNISKLVDDRTYESQFRNELKPKKKKS